MNERDDIDRALADGLGALAPEVDGADAALAAMRPRLQRARARRRFARTSVIVVALVGFASAAALAAPRGSGGRVHVSGSTTVPPNTAAAPSSTSTSTSSTPTTAHRSPSTTKTVPRGAAPPSTVPLEHRSPGHSPGGPPSSIAPTSTPSVASPQDHSYTSPGGTLTLRVASGRLTLESYAPATGYQADVHTNTPDDIEVRFDNNAGEWRIRVRVQNGTLTPEITRH